MLSRYFKRDEKGFTLIELLIVVAIIGILAAIAIPNLITAQRRARYSRAAGDTKELVTQSMVVVSDNNQVITAIPGMTGPLSPTGLWDTTAPNNLTYMAIVNDPWAPNTNGTCQQAGNTLAGGFTCYQLFESNPATCVLGPGCVTYAAWSVGANAADDSGGAWTGLFGTLPAIDDLGNSTVMGCVFGPNTGVANPC